MNSDEPISLAGRIVERSPRRDLWIFHIEERPDQPRMWVTTVDDVGGRGVQAEIEFGSEPAAVAHLKAYVETFRGATLEAT